MFGLFKKKAEDSNTQQIVVNICGMHCSSCAMNIDGELEDMHGIHSSSTSYTKSQTVVKYDPAVLAEREIVKVIETLGYTVR